LYIYKNVSIIAHSTSNKLIDYDVLDYYSP